MFVGCTGVGKTIALAKYAAELVANDIDVDVITCDVDKIGAVDQLKGFTNILDVPLDICRTTEEMLEVISRKERYKVTLIDTPGINPHDHNELSEALQRILAMKVSPIYVTNAGLDSAEELERGKVFA